VNPVYLFDLASRHAAWASARQAVITGNIANANTPGYKTQDIQRFTDVFDQTSLTMASTEPGHLGADASGRVDNWDVKDTGGPVSLEVEMLKAGDINRGFSLDMDVMRAFNRMLMASVRTGG
jgi:flagellar basal-body rod protein FlgB